MAGDPKQAGKILALAGKRTPRSTDTIKKSIKWHEKKIADYKKRYNFWSQKLKDAKQVDDEITGHNNMITKLKKQLSTAGKLNKKGLTSLAGKVK